MFNVCPGCGEYSDDKEIDPSGPFAICARCGHRHRFVQLPLYVVTGASGTGKTAIALQLTGEVKNAICLESDILWRDEFNKPEDDYQDYRNLWLRVAKNINQSGKPVVLFGSATPGQFEACAERRYFSDIHYLALVCDQQVLTERLKARPTWRKSGNAEVLQQMCRFNQWIKENAENSAPAMTLLDTTRLSLDESKGAVRGWLNERIAALLL